jgi:hypothetical protein
LNAATLATATIPEKLTWLGERYWKFGRDDALADYLCDLYDVDEEGGMTAEPRRDPLTGETRGLMVLAKSGSGKTAMFMRAMRNSKVLNDTDKGSSRNTLFITVKPEATIKGLAKEIAKETGYPEFDSRINALEAWDIARRRLKMTGIKTLVIDECHHLLRKGSGRDIPGSIQALKNMMQEDHAVALIIIGVPELRDAIQQEPSGETLRRFDAFYPPDIQDGSAEAHFFSRCLNLSADKLGIGINPEEEMAERILFAEHGEAGRSAKLAKEVLRQAVIKKRTALSLADAERIFIKGNKAMPMTPFCPGDWAAVQAELEAMGWVR